MNIVCAERYSSKIVKWFILKKCVCLNVLYNFDKLKWQEIQDHWLGQLILTNFHNEWCKLQSIMSATDQNLYFSVISMIFQVS